MGSPSPQIEIFDDDECWRRISDFRVARVGVTVRGHPWVFPVHVHIDRPTVTFQTGAGVILHGAMNGPSVAVQFDDLAVDGSGGWSVVVGGKAVVLDDDDEVEALSRATDLPWDRELKPYLVQVRAQTVTGRSLTFEGET
jgi:nitroimidazol reductase NimA-like FMN-containing flavoprotein (pyridoxamine 5'-phosphate oxidase superfamily)